MKKCIAILLILLVVALPLCSVAESSAVSEYQEYLVGSWKLAEGYGYAHEAFDKKLSKELSFSEDSFSNGSCMLFASGNGEVFFRWAIDLGYMESVAIITFSADHNYMMLYKPNSAMGIVYKRQ